MESNETILNSQELVKKEVDALTEKIKNNYKNFKRIAIDEAWKTLQIVIASIVQIIEIVATDLASKDKKLLAMNLVSNFYDKVFIVVDVPVVPNFLEPTIHKYVKGFLMILVSSSIDATVTIFRSTGVFIKKQHS